MGRRRRRVAVDAPRQGTVRSERDSQSGLRTLGNMTGFTDLQPLQPLMDKCVHCGFCLATCPSYLLLGQEMDSPRGRVYLMKAGVEERVSLTPSVVTHFDTCLGC